MWSRLRTIGLGARHLGEENCKDEPGIFSTFKYLTTSRKAPWAKVTGKTPVALSLAPCSRSESSNFSGLFWCHPPLLPTILLNQSQYTCCLTCSFFSSFSPSQGTSPPIWVPQSITQRCSHLFSNPLSLWLSVTITQTPLMHSPSPATTMRLDAPKSSHVPLPCILCSWSDWSNMQSLPFYF